MDHNMEYLKNLFLHSGLEVTEQMQMQFCLYYKLLTEWNQVMNLTTITDFHEVSKKHFLDSVVFATYLNLNFNLRVIDIGTGAGFPGVPLKILYPSLDVVLVDSLKKRLNFLDTLIQQLGLKHITTIHGRAEDLAHQKDYREQFDLCVSRAVANLSSLCEYCLPFVKMGGSFVSYKSSQIDMEVHDADHAICSLGGQLDVIHKYQLQDTEYLRSLVFIKKQSATPKKYPRKAGTPTKQPL